MSAFVQGPSGPTAGSGAVETSPGRLSHPATGIIAALFCGYLAVGLPLPVIPLFLHAQLGFSAPVVGLVIGIQFAATVLTRGYAGRITDQHGGKRSALQGAGACALAGLLYVIAGTPGLPVVASLGVVVIGRLVAGFGESQFVTGCVSWSIASVGPQRAGMSMSWTGIAMFAALAIAAPIGMFLYQSFGLEAAMIACIAAPLVAALIAVRETSHSIPSGPGLPFYKVVGQIWREGFGLMLQGVGLSGLTAFASLYFVARGWGNAGLVMTVFGIGFILIRVLLGFLPDRIGGYRVAAISLAIEAVGQALIWMADNEAVALAGAFVTGLGCALIFPALGVEVLKRVPPANRGSAMGAFVAFLDIAYGLSGPIVGGVATQFGYPSVYLFGALCALAGAGLSQVARISQLRDTPKAGVV
ncbi:MFS family permease [Rhizobium leguminosarum]|uniref:MFS family permease n=1 Tax=Rhizobium leguminosarum TaxID=384 RepID=A0A7W9ZQW7_RHILE|nr:arabinose transporter [Rhizobium leguminosarum]MBB5661840.1 MFS family permease [Rhizobium leguminosarum]MBB6219864.1 MFS family permease [Rhizobium leguminosarum]NYJ13312.1 MFS family permease [Rhizobium leguminosarum]